MANSKSTINYAQRLRDIRPFVDFDYDLRKPLSSAAKAQISRHWEYIQKLTVRPHRVYRSKNAENLRAVQRFAQHDPKHFPHVKVAFVPNPTKERMRITVGKDGRVRGKTKNIAQVEIPLDAEELAAADENGILEDYIDALIDEAPPAKRYVVRAGAFEVPSARSREHITEYVADLMQRYGASKYDPDDKDSHYYANWMFGITGYNFEEQSDLEHYRAEKRRLTKVLSAAEVAKRRAEKRIAKNPPGFWLNDEKMLAKLAKPPQPKGWRQVAHREYFKAIYQGGYREIKDTTRR